MDSFEADALRRAREIHSNQRNIPYPHQNTSSPRVSESAKTPTDNKRKPETFQNDYSEGELYSTPSPKGASAVSGLFEDKEKLLILVLVMILMSEDNSDPATVLALLYLII